MRPLSNTHGRITGSTGGVEEGIGGDATEIAAAAGGGDLEILPAINIVLLS